MSGQRNTLAYEFSLRAIGSFSALFALYLGREQAEDTAMRCHASRTPAPVQAKADPSRLFAPARRFGTEQRPEGARPTALPAGLGAAFSLADVPVHARPAGTTGQGGLPEPLKAGVERLSGLAMDDVRVHRNSPEPAKLGALAFAKGSDIHLGPGQERHLPHEAWHVVQQKQGRVQATTQMKGGEIGSDQALEQEADTMSGKLDGIHSLGEPAATYMEAILYDELRFLTKLIGATPQGKLAPRAFDGSIKQSFVFGVVEEMKKILAVEYQWKMKEFTKPASFKFGVEATKDTEEVSVAGEVGGVLFARGKAGEPEKTLQAAFDKALQAQLGNVATEDAAKKSAADKKAAEKAARKAAKGK